MWTFTKSFWKFEMLIKCVNVVLVVSSIILFLLVNYLFVITHNNIVYQQRVCVQNGTVVYQVMTDNCSTCSLHEWLLGVAMNTYQCILGVKVKVIGLKVEVKVIDWLSAATVCGLIATNTAH